MSQHMASAKASAALTRLQFLAYAEGFLTPLLRQPYTTGGFAYAPRYNNHESCAFLTRPQFLLTRRIEPEGLPNGSGAFLVLHGPFLRQENDLRLQRLNNPRSLVSPLHSDAHAQNAA